MLQVIKAEEVRDGEPRWWLADEDRRLDYMKPEHLHLHPRSCAETTHAIVDRPAPTPTPAPGLDLDAVERDVDNIDEGDLSLKVGAYVVRTVEVHAPALIAEVRALRRHYDAAGPDHNLLALLDLYHEREQAALAKLAETTSLLRSAGDVSAERPLVGCVLHDGADIDACGCPACGCPACGCPALDSPGAIAYRGLLVKARAEIARLTAELAAARAVPADVEEAILTLVGVTICETSRQPHSADDPSPPMDVARNALRTAIARAISDATAAAVDEFIDGHAKRLCEQAGYKWSRDDEDSDGEADDWALEIHDVLNHLRADKDLTIHDGRSSARGTVGGLCGECGGEGVILGGDDGHGNQEEWPCRSCTRGPLPKGGCTHAVTHRGANIPRRYGSWQSEVCDACGSFRARDHHGNLADMGRWREWRPASEYAAAIDDTDEGATRGPLPKGG